MQFHFFSAVVIILSVIFVSSANSDILQVTPSSMSFMSVIKGTLPSAEPCGTPLRTLRLSDVLTLFSINQNFKPRENFAECTTESLVGILPKAFWKSREITSTATVFSYMLRTSL